MAQAQHGQIIATISMIPQMLGSLRCHDGDDEREQRERQKTATRTAQKQQV